ncbi:P1 family peptidase [Falsirhodobacter halotolerans]|uniref:DmpA family aminopeptidase n=1 Tax=Falsirhodobacter halotolerans TaxID=1146892 RepID=UPI001FD46DC9|nr:P1 family peptidase [Falsirhodobacter halotolerans]MCJ8140907.1 P1 family peptidase [Falsirhodobacter halotolerans]
MRLRDHIALPGHLPTGPRNSVTDVPGVQVGHATIQGGGLNTGVTAILPAPGNLFEHKLTAAVEVINGFGKSAGLVQVAELGSLETPILLTNTFGVGTCANALIRRAIAESPDIGRGTSTVNPVVCECNDGTLSDIQAMAVTEDDARRALAAAGPQVAEGSVGAGTGMVAFGFKGGIGTASRRIDLDGGAHLLGALVLANFGRAGDLILPDGRRPDPAGRAEAEKGSVIVVLATDLPVDQRQLARICRRAGAGLARLGAFYGNGSGDIVLGFTTHNRIPHRPAADMGQVDRMADTRIDLAFRAACEATEEAVLNALCAATAVTGWNGAVRPLLSDWLNSPKNGRSPPHQ